VSTEEIGAAFRAEAERLSAAMAAAAGGAGGPGGPGGPGEAAFGRASPCPPWTVGELLAHVRAGVGRLAGMLTAPEPGPGGGLIDAVGYYRPDQRFSPAVNADRIATAQREAAGRTAAALAAGFEQAWRQAWALVRAAPPGRVVVTRHGDRMLMTEFLRTRVLELAAHGLDLAAGLGRAPWLTDEAAAVVEDLVLPGAAAAGIRARLGWDRPALVAAVTGRRPLTEAEAVVVRREDVRWLAFG
jgi:uncharacterized protein (TIGR03083 family)